MDAVYQAETDSILFKYFFYFEITGCFRLGTGMTDDGGLTTQHFSVLSHQTISSQERKILIGKKSTWLSTFQLKFFSHVT